MVYFTDAEKKWLDMKPFNWNVKKNCPPEIEKSLKKKLAFIARYNEMR